MVRSVVFAVLLAGFVAPAVARGSVRVEGKFRSQGDSVLCIEWVENDVATVFTCYRPSDGRYARFEATDLYDSIRPRVVFGTDPSLVGVLDTNLQPYRVGRTWISSDAALIACRVTRNGVRCHHWTGPGFELGSVAGEREFATRRPRHDTSVPR